jgi:hypothetical protein
MLDRAENKCKKMNRKQIIMQTVQIPAVEKSQIPNSGPKISNRIGVRF